jgi:hypothetical protein
VIPVSSSVIPVSSSVIPVSSVETTRSPCSFQQSHELLPINQKVNVLPISIAKLSASLSFLWRKTISCVQSADRQPPATDLWLNRFEPDDHRVAVDRPPSSVLSRLHSR